MVSFNSILLINILKDGLVKGSGNKLPDAGFIAKND